ncbi:hypothetical protein BDR22DRAFT_961956 [Usnea florida]
MTMRTAPSSPSAPASASASLPQQINIATRPLHTTLNTLILSLLPLALPPHVQDPALYAEGMRWVLGVYGAFEGVLALEEGLCVKGLERGKRGRVDVESVLGPGIGDLEWEKRPCLRAFTEHIRKEVTGKRHLLLAYTWVLYMALFSGGRYIRARLRGAGVGFWRAGDGVMMVDDDGEGGEVDGYLGFWTFEGSEDGEDIKVEFKTRFAAVEGTLTEGERQEVVQEAVFIMRSMIELVMEISDVVGNGPSVATAPAAGQPAADESVDSEADDEPSMRWLLLKHVLPMGMVELMAAGARTVVGVGMGSSLWGARAE